MYGYRYYVNSSLLYYVVVRSIPSKRLGAEAIGLGLAAISCTPI